MTFINKIRRYPLSNFYLLIGMIIAYTAFISGGAIVEALYNDMQVASNYSYDSEMMVEFKLKDTGCSLENLLSDKDMNVELPDYMASVGKGTRLIQICLSSKESIPYDIVEGRYPTDEEIDNELAVINIGIALKKYTYRNDGCDYIKVDGIEYKVVGYFGNNESDVINSLIYIHYNCLSKVHKESIMAKDTYSIRYGSNYNDVSPYVNEIVCGLSDSVVYTIADKEPVKVGSVEKNTWKNIAFLIYAFALAICVIVSELWIYERREEITILKISGLSNVYICKRLYTEFLVCALFSCVFASIVNVIGGAYLDNYDVHINTDMISMIVLMLLLSSVIIFAIPMYKIYKTEPISAIGDMKR